MLMTKTGMIMEKTAGGMSCQRSEQVWNQNLWASGHYASARILFCSAPDEPELPIQTVTANRVSSLDNRDLIDIVTALFGVSSGEDDLVGRKKSVDVDRLAFPFEFRAFNSYRKIVGYLCPGAVCMFYIYIADFECITSPFPVE